MLVQAIGVKQTIARGEFPFVHAAEGQVDGRAFAQIFFVVGQLLYGRLRRIGIRVAIYSSSAIVDLRSARARCSFSLCVDCIPFTRSSP